MVRGGYQYSNWGSLVTMRSGEEAPIDIQLEGRYNTAERAGTLDMTIYAEGVIRWEGLTVRVALTEDSIYYQAPNGTNYHNFTLRDMIPTANGTPLEIAQGETRTMNFDFSCSDQLNWQRCRLVAWVQADITEKEILQTAAINLPDLNITSIDVAAPLPEATLLSQNYPNPFNGKTAIEYSLRKPGHIELSIYDVLGGMVATLVNEEQESGTHRIIWDGRDSNGDDVAAGIYFYQLLTDSQAIARRMMLLK